MLYPINLEKGNKIGVSAPSAGCGSPVDEAALESAVQNFKERGYPVIITENVKHCEEGRSAHAKVRAIELMDLFEQQEVKAVIAAHGGDFLLEILPYLDYDKMKMNPKWVQGYSDTTGLTFTLTTNLDMATIYSYNFGTFGMVPWHKSLSDALCLLEGKHIIQESFQQYQDGYLVKETGREEFRLEKDVLWRNLIPKTHENQQEIHLKGRMLGGCLDVLLNLVGTKYDKTVEFIEKYQQDGIVWFLESFDLSAEALTRGLWQLKQAGWFRYAAGFIFGRPAMYRSDYDITYDKTVISVLGELEVPIILDADIGHKPPQCAVINGSIGEIHSKNGKGRMVFHRL